MIAVTAAALALPAQAATAASSSVKLPPAAYMGDCSGDVPVVVASDTAAQSDIYSAITLAGVLGTDCVVLAGPRHTDVPSDQAARLAAAKAGGYVVGGMAAVPDWKVSGRSMVRISGNDRWATAERVGDEAKKVGAGSSTTPAAISGQRPETDPPAAADRASSLKLPPSKYLGNCAGKVPVVVASDAAAQSDIYSAITLAGALGTDCVILAGARGAGMDAAQEARLEAANAGGYVAGGTAAVPDWKVSGRSMVRISGSDRWATAERVGDEAKKIGAGTPTTPKLIQGERPSSDTQEDTDETTATGAAASDPSKFVSLGAGGWYNCAMRSDGTLVCWGSNTKGQANPPAGTFKQVEGGSGHSCAVRVDDTLLCWGHNEHGQANAPGGRFRAVSTGNEHSCAIQHNKRLICWGMGGKNQLDKPNGTFDAVSAGWDFACAIRTNKKLVCWGSNTNNQQNVPTGNFKVVSSGGVAACAVRTDNALLCWGANALIDEVPKGSFATVAVGWSHACALRTNGAVVCWGSNEDGVSEAPSGKYTTVSAGWYHTCAIRKDGNLTCWGSNEGGQLESDRLNQPSRPELVRGIRANSLTAGSWHSCAIRTDDTIDCWGYSQGSRTKAPDGSFKAIDGGVWHTCGIRTNETLACWGGNTDGETDPPAGTYKTLSLGKEFGCAIRTNNSVICWGNNEHGKAEAPNGQFLDVAAGDDHVCAIRSSGTLTCWGRNENGQLDAPSGTFKSVKAGRVHMCAIRNDNSLNCWGYNDDGRASAPDGAYRDVSVGTSHTCAIRNDRTLACWGDNRFGKSAALTGKFVAVGIGDRFTCGLRTDKSVICWGDNSVGQLNGGIYNVVDGFLAVRADGSTYEWESGFSKFRKTSDGNAYSSVSTGIWTILSDGRAGYSHAWLSASDGVNRWRFFLDDLPRSAPNATAVALGFLTLCIIEGVNNTIECEIEGDANDGRLPYAVPSGAFKEIAAGVSSLCAIRLNGAVVCAGGSSQKIVTDAPTGGNYSGLKVGMYHERGDFSTLKDYACAIGANGQLKCWGHGELGSSTPPGGTYKAVSTGSGKAHACAIRTDGVLKCWGNNDSGQADVPSGTFTAVSASNQYTCAIRTSGELICWGKGYDGVQTAPVVDS